MYEHESTDQLQLDKLISEATLDLSEGEQLKTLQLLLLMAQGDESLRMSIADSYARAIFSHSKKFRESVDGLIQRTERALDKLVRI